MYMPSKELIEMLKRRYPAGTRVKLNSMNDPYSRLGYGDCGTVRVVDDMGTIHVDWDCGSRLGLVFDEDDFEVIKEAKA